MDAASSRSAQIRHLIHSALNCLGARPEVKPRETLLIRNGTYCGHRFEQDGFQAVWFVEEDEVKLYRRDGTLAERLVPSQALSAQRSIAA